MSGIAGVFYRDGRTASSDVVARMAGVLAHRGNGARIICVGAAGFAQMAFPVSDAPPRTNPVLRRASQTLAVADARLDNRDELIGILRIADGVRTSDASLIAAAYERWGTRCTEHLVGDFAFVISDGRRGEIFCARDAMGVKPLYWFESRDLFAFASEARALLALAEVPRELDPIHVAMFIDGTIGDRDRTHFKAIRRLPAAHTMVVDRSQTTQAEYWRPDPHREVRLGSSQDYADAFLEIFTEAVRTRMRTAKPVAAALSGGLDSSSIVCVARELQRAVSTLPIETISLVFPSLPQRDLRLIDERRYIDSVIRGGGVEATEVLADELSPTDMIDEALEHLDEPFAAPNLYLHWAMYRAARGRGAEVFLDGFDGDTTVSHGFGRLDGLMHRGEWQRYEHELRALATRRGVRAETLVSHLALPQLASMARRGSWLDWVRTVRQLNRRFALPLASTTMNFGLRPAVPARIRSAYRAARRAPAASTGLLRRELARSLREHAPTLRDEASPQSEREAHILGLMQPAYQATLELADQCAAAFGIEPAYPFFDRRLIDFCVAVPESEKLADGWPRLVFRRAMAGILPEEIRLRSDKGNLSPNFHRGLRAALADSPELSPDSPLADFVEPGALDELRRDYCAETSTLGRSAEGHMLYRLLVLERWLARERAPAKASVHRSPVMAGVA